MRAEAQVVARTEGEMTVRVSIDVDRFAVGELVGVHVGRADEQRHVVARVQLDATDADVGSGCGERP